VRRVYVDAAYYIALLLENDDLHRAALRISADLLGTALITSDPILVEVLAHTSRLGPRTRRESVGLIDDLRASDGVRVLPQTRELFDAGLDLYRRRLDKGYSMTDCMSMVICREPEITEVLTHDQHFAQEGFTVLL
jgi:predicted nucleic acid-binding protein